MAPDMSDSWGWGGCKNRSFTTKNLTKLIDEKTLKACADVKETLINNLVPKKVGVFIWRARKKRLPVRKELYKWGIDLHSVRCPLCDGDIETVDHTLISCKKVDDVWNKVKDWWGFGSTSYGNIEDLLQGNVRQPCSDAGKLVWQVVMWTSAYQIWKNINQMLFKNKEWTDPMEFSEIQIKSFE
ncbi:uncharacterized protein [Rutidosis leptorrhynchoides]|uniref:uncharacterized protein n=1 Tax=Rutidosis leptorrhynchoides TaxID=125765 RepID=UPI003A99ADF9